MIEIDTTRWRTTMNTSDNEILTPQQIEALGYEVDDDGDAYDPTDARFVEPAGDAK